MSQKAMGQVFEDTDLSPFDSSPEACPLPAIADTTVVFLLT